MQIDLTLRRPHARQRQFIESPAPRKIIRAGRRGGKTTGAAILAVKQFLLGHRVLYAVPVAAQMDAFWAEISRALMPVIAAGVFQKNETLHMISAGLSPQRIRAKTAWNADTLRGDYADLLILDEWQLMDESAWEEVGQPMLLDNNGSAVFIYTPPSLHSRSVTKARDPRHAGKMFKIAAADETGHWLALHFTSHENPHISKKALATISRDMTRLAYRQEVLAEDIDEIPGALWTRTMIEKVRLDKPPAMERIVIGVDPSGSGGTEAGIVACGAAGGLGYVLEDRSMLASNPQGWAAAAVALYHGLKADCIVAERNFGGDMVKSTIQTVDPTVKIIETTSSRGKIVRAEPIAAMTEQGRIKFCGKFDALEDELCSYTLNTSRSPNRLDAMVFSLSELMLQPASGYLDWLETAAEELRKEESAPAPKEIKAEPPKSSVKQLESPWHDLPEQVKNFSEQIQDLADTLLPR